jgi:hypothetical protein
MPIPLEKWERMGEDESPCYQDIDEDTQQEENEDENTIPS